MPARSRAQLAAILIAERHPDKLKPDNKGLLSMSPKQMRDFTDTPSKKLPYRVPKFSPPKPKTPKMRKFYGAK